MDKAEYASCIISIWEQTRCFSETVISLEHPRKPRHVKGMDEFPALSLHLLERRPAPPLWSLSGTARLHRQFERLGVSFDPGASRLLLLRSDAVYDLSVLRGLLTHPEVALVDGSGEPLAAQVMDTDREAAEAWLLGRCEAPPNLAVRTAGELGESYNAVLRKKEQPFAALVTDATAQALEWRLFQGSYKGVTDLVTKYIWPRPASHVTRFCARLGIRPNFVTALSAVLVLFAAYEFAAGCFTLGLLAAWPMTFLDTVDGKLARVTLTSTRLGNIFDHGIDLVHPPFWYLAWAYGLAASDHPLPPGWFAPAVAAIFVGYIAGRLIEGYFIARFGLELHVWRRFDSRFRLIVARRNPNLLLLTASLLLNRPDLGLLAVAGWTVFGVLVHLIQLLQAERAPRRAPLISWLAQ